MEKAHFPETLAEKIQGNSPVAAGRLHNTPRADGFYMPAEWALHKQTWLIWPERPDVWRLGGKPVQAVFTKVAKAIADFEPVTVCVSTEQYENARARLNHANIRVVEMSYDGEWVRDTGPTFVINKKGEVRGVHWDFNAWGGLNGGHCFPWARDQQVAQKILEIEHCMRYRPEYCVEHHTKQFILEGGSIHVDGEGTLITTTECLLNPNRNPDCGRHEIEEILCEYLSVEKIIWLEKGIYNDETSGHVDNLCCFVRPGELVLSWTDDPIDPNFEICHAALDVLKQSTDAKGRPLIIHKLPIPILCATEEECSGIDESTSTHCQPNVRLPGSYVNFLIVNGGIVAPSFGDTIKDLEALTVMKQIWPERKIVQIYSREIILGLGNIHCITQQQPAGQQEK